MLCFLNLIDLLQRLSRLLKRSLRLLSIGKHFFLSLDSWATFEYNNIEYSAYGSVTTRTSVE